MHSSREQLELLGEISRYHEVGSCRSDRNDLAVALQNNCRDVRSSVAEAGSHQAAGSEATVKLTRGQITRERESRVQRSHCGLPGGDDGSVRLNRDRSRSGTWETGKPGHRTAVRAEEKDGKSGREDFTQPEARRVGGLHQAADLGACRHNQSAALHGNRCRARQVSNLALYTESMIDAAVGVVARERIGGDQNLAVGLQRHQAGSGTQRRDATMTEAGIRQSRGGEALDHTGGLAFDTAVRKDVAVRLEEQPCRGLCQHYRTSVAERRIERAVGVEPHQLAGVREASTDRQYLAVALDGHSYGEVLDIAIANADHAGGAEAGVDGAVGVQAHHNTGIAGFAAHDDLAV